ncbi:MAG TPA: hypothetical protein DEO88_09415 [Syntrophobacteraceae bacterium]|jgi:hypothetical protein|nr:hypothetical protein [Syntrophobacteraceae bacterium]
MNNSRRFGSAGETRFRIGAVLLSLLTVVGVLTARAATTDQPLMVERNLFSADRKPLDTKIAEPGAEAPKLPKGAVQLDGIFIHGDVRKAILRVNPSFLKKTKNKTDPFVSVGENEQVGDYKVVKIEPRSITLEQRGASFVIPLFMPGKVSPPPPKIPTAASPSPQPGPSGAQPQPQVATPMQPDQPQPVSAAQIHPPGQPGAMPLPPGAIQTPPGGPGGPMEMPAGVMEMQPPPNVEMGASDEPQ